jgi:hypothetical protein
MALKRNANGQYVIKHKDEAIRALAMVLRIQAEIDALNEEHGISEMMQDAAELKKAATAFCNSKSIDVVNLPEKKYAKLIRSASSRYWIGTKADIPQSANAAKPLKSLVSKEMWLKLTKRVPDPAKIDKAVAEQVVKLEDIEDAYVEIPRAPYLRIYDEGDEEE